MTEEPAVGAGLPVAPGRPHVWSFDVTAEWFDALADSRIVSREESDRAAALTNADAARRLLARRTALRLLLADYAVVQPQDVRIVTAPGGKPVLIPAVHASSEGSAHRAPLAFSVAHSGDLYCVAIGSVASLGLDVERHRHVARARAIASRWFGPREAERLADLDEVRLDAEFIRLWTGKEALAKRHGAGLRLMVGGARDGDVGELDVDGALREGRLHYFTVSEGYTAALASTLSIEGIEVERPEESPWTT